MNICSASLDESKNIPKRPMIVTITTITKRPNDNSFPLFNHLFNLMARLLFFINCKQNKDASKPHPTLFYQMCAAWMEYK